MANDVELPEGYGVPSVELPEGFRVPKSTLEDTVRGVGSGIAMAPANLAGTAGDLVEFARKHGVSEKVLDAIPYAPPFALFSLAKKYLTGSASLPTSEGIKEAVPGYKGLDYEPETGAGEIGKRAGEFLGGAALSPARSAGQFAANLLRFGLAPAAGSEAAGAAAHTWLPGAEPYARLGGSFVGSGMASHLISPNASMAPLASAASHAEHVGNVERALGIKVTPGEKSNSTLLRIKEDELNPEHYLANREAVTKRATRDVAPEYETPTIKPPVVNSVTGAVTEPGTLGEMRAGIGRKFEAVTSNPRNNLEMDPANGAATGTAIQRLLNKYVHAAGYDKDAVDALHNAADHVRDVLVANGPSARTNLMHLTGEQYQRMRSSLMDSAMSAEGQKKHALHDFIDVLDNSFDRSLRTYNPGDLGKIQEARRQWRAFLTVEKAAGRADVDHLTPAGLEAAAQQTYGKGAHLQGKDPFWWAPSAKSVLRTEANSNTARRKEAREALADVLGLPLAALGYGVGMRTGGGNAEHAVGGLLIAEKAAGPLAKILQPHIDKLSGIPEVQAWAGNQVLAGAKGLLDSRAGPLTAAAALRPPDYEDRRNRSLLSVP